MVIVKLLRRIQCENRAYLNPINAHHELLFIEMTVLPFVYGADKLFKHL